MTDTLEMYLRELATHGRVVDAAVRVAEALAPSRPWEAIRLGGRLARCSIAHAAEDIGLDRHLRVRPIGAEGVVVRVGAGEPYPVMNDAKRHARAVVDPPIHVARQVVARCIAEASGPVNTMLDIACGHGAFLLAAVEAGVPEVYGIDADEAALRIARVAVPHARLLTEDGLKYGPEVDVVVGCPPYVPPARQDAQIRWELRRRHPSLLGRFDLVVPFAASAVQRTRPGGATGLVVPNSLLVQPHAEPLRRRWLERHRIAELAGPVPFPQHQVDAMLLVLQKGGLATPLPAMGLHPAELLALPNVTLDADYRPGDIELVVRIRENSVLLSEVADVDSGLVLIGPEGGSASLVHEDEGEGRVPFANARDWFRAQRSWLDYRPGAMHRPRERALFEGTKLIVERTRTKGPIRAAVDVDGVFVDQSCTLVRGRTVPTERLLDWIRSPVADAVTRVERGDRFDLHPRDLERFPVPRRWLTDPSLPLEEAWGLSADDLDRLKGLSAQI